MPDQTPATPGPETRGATSATSAEPARTQTPTSTTAQPSRRRYDAMAVLIPAATFLVGLLIGAVLVWAGSDRVDGTATAGSAPTQAASVPAASPTAQPDATVTVPGACLDVADSAQAAADLVQDAATAAQDLDAAELSSIVRSLQDSRDEIEARAGACRAEAGTG